MPAPSLTMGIVRPKRAGIGFFRRSRPARAALAGALLLGCGGAPATVAPPPPRAPNAAASSAGGFDGGWGERYVARVPARLRLPDARAWHASASGTFTVLTHGPTGSVLALRVTLAPRRVRPSECEADARLARPSLPGDEQSGVVERRVLAAPAGFDVRLRVGVEPRAGEVHGYALAVGAATSRCYVAAFETDAAGASAAERVADRLAVVVTGTLERMRIPSAEQRR